jgi:hypothetical protein
MGSSPIGITFNDCVLLKGSIFINMKQCQRCKQEKSLDFFNNNKREKDGKQRACRECTKIEHQKWYTQNKTTQLEKNEELRKKKINRYLEFKKQHKCIKCGDNRHYVLDWHHRDPLTKTAAISDLIGRSEKKLYEEIAKCDPICRNCHAELHWLEKKQ